MKPARPVPNRLEVYQALCGLSPRIYASLARFIVGIHRDEIERFAQSRAIRRARKAARGNLTKPVIDAGFDDDREGA